MKHVLCQILEQVRHRLGPLVEDVVVSRAVEEEELWLRGVRRNVVAPSAVGSLRLVHVLDLR